MAFPSPQPGRTGYSTQLSPVSQIRSQTQRFFNRNGQEEKKLPDLACATAKKVGLGGIGKNRIGGRSEGWLVGDRLGSSSRMSQATLIVWVMRREEKPSSQNEGAINRR